MKDSDIHDLEEDLEREACDIHDLWDMYHKVPTLIDEIRRLRALLNDPLPEKPLLVDDDGAAA